MKITEIISEQRTDELVGTLLKGIGTIARGAKTGAKDIGAMPAASRTGQTFSKSIFGKYARSKVVRQTRNARAAYRARAENFARDTLSDDILKWATRIAIVDGIYDYYSAKSLLDDLLKNGEITKEQYDSDLTQLRGVFVTAILMPRLAGGLAKGTGNIIGSILTKLGASRTGEAVRFWNGIMAKGGEAAGLAIMSTDAGKKWLADSMTWLVTSTGSVTNLLADFVDIVKAVAQTATGNTPQGFEKSQKPGDQQSTDNPWGANQPWGSGQKRIFKDPFAGERDVGLL